MLMYPLGAQSVKCSVCHFVTNVCPHAAWPPVSSAPGPVQQRPAVPPKSMQTVVVENPPTLDEQGNEVRAMLLQFALSAEVLLRICTSI
jgi:LSD1 subclass zinc finger protein